MYAGSHQYPANQPWRIALKMLVSGLRLGDFVRIDAVAELLVPPLSFLVGWCLLTLIASLLLLVICRASL